MKLTFNDYRNAFEEVIVEKGFIPAARFGLKVIRGYSDVVKARSAQREILNSGASSDKFSRAVKESNLAEERFTQSVIDAYDFEFRNDYKGKGVKF